MLLKEDKKKLEKEKRLLLLGKLDNNIVLSIQWASLKVTETVLLKCVLQPTVSNKYLYKLFTFVSCYTFDVDPFCVVLSLSNFREVVDRSKCVSS